MRKDWEVKKLGDICEISYGNRVVKSRDSGSLYPVYGGGGATFFMDTYNREDSVVISRFGMSPKCVRFVKGKFFLNDSGLSLIANKNILCQSYLDMAMFALNDAIYSLGKGAAQKNLDVIAFNKLNIKYPISLVKQQQIVEELNCLTSIIEKQKKQLEELDNLAQSIFYEMFGSIHNNKKSLDINNLNDLCEFIKDGTHNTPQYTDDKVNGVKFLSAKDVVEGCINWENIKYIPYELHEELHKRIAPQRDDILLCKNGTTGIAAIVDTDDVFDIYVSLALLRFKKPYNAIYVLYAINNPYTKEQFNSSLKGVGVPNLHLGEIKKARILWPPLSLQQKFASKIEAIEKQKQLIKKSIKETEDLFYSRMDYYFN